MFTHNSYVQIFYFPSASQLSGDGEHLNTCIFPSMLIHKIHDNLVLFIFLIWKSSLNIRMYLIDLSKVQVSFK